MKKNRKKGIPVLIAIGILTMGTFYFLFGGLMLIRYLLGSLMFATITLALIKTLNNTWGKKRIFK